MSVYDKEPPVLPYLPPTMPHLPPPLPPTPPVAPQVPAVPTGAPPPPRTIPRRRGIPTWGTQKRTPAPTLGPPTGWQDWPVASTDPTLWAQFVHNWLMMGLDPSTQWEVGHWLARQNPAVFGVKGYGPGAPANTFFGYRQPQATPEMPPGYLAQRLDLLLNSGKFDVQNFANAIGLPAETVIPNWGPMSFIMDYLRTARQGLSTDWRQTSRAQRVQAMKRLATLRAEAEASQPRQGAQSLAPYLSLAEMLVNPMVRRGRLSGGVGQQRVIQTPFGEAIRGVYRNPQAMW